MPKKLYFSSSSSIKQTELLKNYSKDAKCTINGKSTVTWHDSEDDVIALAANTTALNHRNAAKQCIHSSTGTPKWENRKRKYIKNTSFFFF